MQTPLSYAQKYGRKLLGMNSPQAVSGAFGGSAQAPALSGAQSFPVNDEAPVVGALSSSGPMRNNEQAPAGNGSDFWSLADKTPQEDKEKIADTLDKQLQSNGSSLEEEFNKHDAAGNLSTPKAVGQKFDRAQMGLYLFEFGLRMAQRAANGESTIGAAAGGALDTMSNANARRAASQERADKLGELAADRKLRADEGAADRTMRKEEGAADRAARSADAAAERAARSSESAADRELRRELNTADNATRVRVERMQKGETRQTFIDEDGQVYWKDTQEPVMVKDAKTGERRPLKSTVKDNSGQVTEKQILEEANKIRAKMDGDVTSQIMIDGKRVPWRSLDETQKAAHMEQVKASMRSQTPSGTGKNPFDQFD